MKSTKKAKLLALLQGHERAAEEIRSVLASLDVAETAAAKLLAREARSGQPYNQEEDERIIAASTSELRLLAEQLGRRHGAVMKRREVLIAEAKAKGRPVDETPPAAPSPAAPAGDAPTTISEPPINQQPTVTPSASRRSSTPPPIKVEGVIDGGPKSQRVYDPIAFASPGRD